MGGGAKSDNKLIIYSPQSNLKPIKELLSDLLVELAESRELAWQLFVRNIRAQYRQTWLAYGWVLMPPVAMAIVWFFLRGKGVIDYGLEVSYELYILSGLMYWQCFADAIQAPLKSVSTSQDMLVKINFPRVALILAGVGEVVFNFLARAVVFFPIMFLAGLHLHEGVFISLLVSTFLIVQGTAIGLILTPLGLLYQDVGRGLFVIIQFWMYITPVVYAFPDSAGTDLWLWVNPIAAIFLSTRDFLLVGFTEYWYAFIIWSFISILALIAGLILYRLAMPFVVERLGS